MIGRRWWRVQAFWYVGDELRNYRPVHHRFRLMAWRSARDMRRTLSHFPALDVRVTRVGIDDVKAAALEDARIEAEEAAARTTWLP